MDDFQQQGSKSATAMAAMVARRFEPVRIERQLLARAFDLVCEVEKRASGAATAVPERAIAEQPIAGSIARRQGL